MPFNSEFAHRIIQFAWKPVGFSCSHEKTMTYPAPKTVQLMYMGESLTDAWWEWVFMIESFGSALVCFDNAAKYRLIVLGSPAKSKTIFLQKGNHGDGKKKFLLQLQQSTTRNNRTFFWSQADNTEQFLHVSQSPFDVDPWGSHFFIISFSCYCSSLLFVWSPFSVVWCQISLLLYARSNAFIFKNHLFFLTSSYSFLVLQCIIRGFL